MKTSLWSRMAGGLLIVLLVCILGINVKAQVVRPIANEGSESFKTLYFGFQPTLFYNAEGNVNNAARGAVLTKVYIHWGGLESFGNDVQTIVDEQEEENSLFSEVEILVFDMPETDKRLPIGLVAAFPKLRFVVFSSHQDLDGIDLNQDNVRTMIGDSLITAQSIAVLFENVTTGQ